MNIEYAQTIPLREILSKIGLHSTQQKDVNYLYRSPFRDDSTPTLQINPDNNTWRDTLTGTGGGPIEFVQAWLAYQKEESSIADALHWLKFNIGYPALLSFLDLPDYEAEDNGYTLNFKTLLLERSLVRYVEGRGIPIHLARKYLKQVYALNKATGKEFLALGFKNEDKGFAIRSSFIKANLAPAAITFIRGREHKQDAIHVFKDIFDYLSAKINQNGKPFSEDSIILNSYRCIDNAASYIRGYGYNTLYSWMDNAQAGKQAIKAFDFLCRTEDNLQHKTMNHLYAPYHDMNAWLVAKLEL